MSAKVGLQCVAEEFSDHTHLLSTDIVSAVFRSCLLCYSILWVFSVTITCCKVPPNLCLVKEKYK